MRRLLVPLAIVMCLLSSVASAKAQPARGLAAVSDETFQAAWADARTAFDADLRAAGGDPDSRKAVYKRILERFFADDRLAEHRDSPQYRASLASLLEEHPDTALAQSTNAPLTNPASNRLIERSGLTELIAIAGDFQKLFSSDDSALSLNLNAVALLGGGRAGDRSAPYLYARREAWRRLGGTVTVGSKIPEKEITGISGLPASDLLFDAFSWDVKYRLIGDRDPRASRWYPLLLGDLGTRVELTGRVISLPTIAEADIELVREVLTALLGTKLADVKDLMARSLQVSVKTAGTHLTKVDGKNKYTVALLLDKGFGALDFTANAAYSVADAAEAGTDPFRTRQLQLSSGLSGSVLKNVLEPNRAIELTAAADFRIPFDADVVPVDRKRIFRVNAVLSVPFQEKGKIPFSITWSNDPNNLTKEKHVSAQVGFSYDFGAIWGAVKKP